MDPIPVTKIKMPKDKWLSLKIKYEDDITKKDILQRMSRRSFQWLNSIDEYNIIKDYDSFENEFINLMYNKYYNER